MAVFSTTSSSASASDPNGDGLLCPPLVAVEGRVTSVADCVPDAASRVGSSYFRLKERALTRHKRDARKTIQVCTTCTAEIFSLSVARVSTFFLQSARLQVREPRQNFAFSSNWYWFCSAFYSSGTVTFDK